MDDLIARMAGALARAIRIIDERADIDHESRSMQSIRDQLDEFIEKYGESAIKHTHSDTLRGM